jgi:hypothetical protein
MNSHMLRFSGPELTRLRNVVADVGKAIALVRAGDTAPPAEREGPTTALEMTWSRLVDMLDLGPEPEMRECPTCKRPGLLGATRCGYCWSSLPAAKDKEKLVA